MNISTKSKYATSAILAIALNQNERNLTRKEISKNHGIPLSYLENIFISLKSNGIIRTIRGPKGGYALAKNPEDITIFEIVDTMDGISNSSPSIENRELSIRSSSYVTIKLWAKLQKAQNDLLKGVTIMDLVKETPELYGSNFSI